MIRPNLDEFKRLSEKSTLVPVYQELFSDSLTPVSAFQRLASDSPHAFLLESASGAETVARYSFLGHRPFAIFRAKGQNVEIKTDSETRAFQSANPIKELAKLVQENRVAQVPGLPRLCCGAVGYVSYDTVRYFERLLFPPADDLLLPDLYFCLYDSLVVFDHLDKTIKVIAAARVRESVNTVEAYQEAQTRVQTMIESLSRPLAPALAHIALGDSETPDFTANMSHDHFVRAVDRIKEYIFAGDIFQAVFSQRLCVPFDTSPFNLYRALRVTNPSPYMFFLRFGEDYLVGSSPEVMAKVEDRKATVRPIAGTRRRGRTPAEDAALAQELLSDPKERAEHVMLLDLGRNDVGRVCKYGTVKIQDQMIIERYSHVMHITSSVSGELRDEFDAFDVLQACLPAGTVSGAPKVRAMEIIDELEPTRRGPYAGAVGYFDFSGNMDTCITIRTILVHDGKAYVQAGAGIVAESVPEREYEETLNKARALLRAINLARSLENGEKE